MGTCQSKLTQRVLKRIWFTEEETLTLLTLSLTARPRRQRHKKSYQDVVLVFTMVLWSQLFSLLSLYHLLLV
jgi:hypothetical protein